MLSAFGKVVVVFTGRLKKKLDHVLLAYIFGNL